MHLTYRAAVSISPWFDREKARTDKIMEWKSESSNTELKDESLLTSIALIVLFYACIFQKPKLVSHKQFSFE